MRILLVTILFTLLHSAELFSQTSDSLSLDKKVVVTLKDGSTLEGEIIEWKLDEYIRIKTAWDPNMTINDEVIKRVNQKNAYSVKPKKPYKFKEEGIYYSAKAQWIWGNNGSRANDLNGYGLSISAGKRFSRLVGVGGGLGYDVFIHDTGEQMIPVFAEFSSYFLPTNNTMFFNLQAGYSFTWVEDDFLILHAKGGPMIYPSLGIRLGEEDTKVTLDIGYKFQKAEYTYRNQWNPNETSAQRITYRRVALRLGILI